LIQNHSQVVDMSYKEVTGKEFYLCFATVYSPYLALDL